MTSYSELFTNFAKLVKVFRSELGHHIANKFENLTAPSIIKPGTSFRHCESRTWKLLAVITRFKNKTDLCQISQIKQWISEVPKDEDLLELIQEDKEVENEIQNMFKRKADAKDVKPNKKRLIETKNRKGRTIFKQQFTTSDEKEDIYKKQFERLRYNDLSLDVKNKCEVTHKYMYNMYCEYQRRALDDTATNLIKGERDAWRENVKYYKENSVGKYRTALYNVLAGDADAMYNTVCDTWEDTIWAYLNKKVENMLDEPEKSNNDPILPSDVVSVASAKDRVMSSEDPRIIFHHIQAAILSGTTETLFKDIYLALYQKENVGASSPFKISDEDSYSRNHLLRFVCTLILYGDEYLGWTESKYTVALLTAYITLNEKGDFSNPAVVAAYTAKLSP